MGKYEELYRIGVSSKGKLVYFYLDDRKNADNVAWPALNTMARELSMSRSSVRRAIQELEKIGLIRKEGGCEKSPKTDKWLPGSKRAWESFVFVVQFNSHEKPYH